MKQVEFFFFFIILSKCRDRLTLEIVKESNLKNIISINYGYLCKIKFLWIWLKNGDREFK